MADQSGVGGGGFDTTPSTFAPDSVAGPSGFTTPTTPMFGAPASTIAASAPMGGAGGGGAVSAPGPGAPSASPAGFDLSSQGAAAFGSTNPAALETAQNVLNAPDPNAPGATAGGAATANVAGAAPSNSILNAVQNPGLNSIMNAVGGNLGPLASLGILGFEAANKPGGIGSTSQQLPAQAQPGPTAGALVQQAGTLQTAGQALTQPLATGVLPPGPQAAVDQLTKAQEAQIRNQFANMGLSGSTMEATALSSAAEQAQARGFQIAQQMAQQGLQDMNLSSGIFADLLRSGLQTDQEFQQALTQFASSLAGGSAKAA